MHFSSLPWVLRGLSASCSAVFIRTRPSQLQFLSVYKERKAMCTHFDFFYGVFCLGDNGTSVRKFYCWQLHIGQQYKGKTLLSFRSNNYTNTPPGYIQNSPDFRCKNHKPHHQTRVKTSHVHPATCNMAHLLTRHRSPTIYPCFTLLQMLYRWRKHYRIFWIHPVTSSTLLFNTLFNISHIQLPCTNGVVMVT
jgi:hypothetical protein